MMRKLACGIATMHGYGIGHRDIKFENLHLTQMGDPVLLDFGSSGYGPRRTSPVCTLTTRSIHLLVLEQKNATTISYDARTVDVWSFAVLYLELLLQVRLLHFDLYRSDTATILRYYQHRIPILLDQLAIRIDVSPHVYVLIRQCLMSSSPAGQPSIEDFA
jgi:serine/threonine protein kinase